MRALKKLGHSNASPGAPSKKSPVKPNVTGEAKRTEIRGLIQILERDLKTNDLDDQRRLDALSRLKVLGREAQDAEPLFTKESIEVVAQQSLRNGTQPGAMREGLRCLANALLLEQATRQFLVDGGFAGKLAELLKSENLEDQFLSARILFLLTYDTDLNFEALAEEHQLCNSINEVLSNQAKHTAKRSRNTARPKPELDALTETLKVVFNMTHHYPSLSPSLSPSIQPILKMLLREVKSIPEPRPILTTPTKYLINALINLDLPDKAIDQKNDAEDLIQILDVAIEQYPLDILDNAAAPLITLIRHVYEVASDHVKRYMAWLLLPTDDERSKPLGTSNTLSARLLRLSISANAPNLKEPISSLMFELSGKDVKTFVKNIGYGFAAGFLASHDMPMPSEGGGNATASMDNATILHGGGGGQNGSTSSAAAGAGASALDENTASEEAGDVDPATGLAQRTDGPGPDEVNFVTGQYLTDEAAAGKEDDGPPMSEDEKLREAEKMFVLFERLKATGVVDVKNPVEEAARAGRFVEVHSDDEG